MISLRDYICEAKKLDPAHEAVVENVYKEIEKLKGGDVKVTYSVAGSGKSSGLSMKLIDKSLKDGFAGELKVSLGFERGKLVMYAPIISMVKDDRFIYLNDTQITSLCPTWKPSFNAVKKGSGRMATYIVAPADYSKLVASIGNLPNQFKGFKMFDTIVKNFEKYTIQAEELAADAMAKPMDRNAFLKEFPVGTDGYRNAVVPRISNIILDEITKTATKDLKDLI
jgi:hypothetical protein